MISVDVKKGLKNLNLKKIKIVHNWRILFWSTILFRYNTMGIPNMIKY